MSKHYKIGIVIFDLRNFHYAVSLNQDKEEGNTEQMEEAPAHGRDRHLIPASHANTARQSQELKGEVQARGTSENQLLLNLTP